jgi:NADH dehydrogenase
MILVTGGTGFIGPKIVRSLRQAGHEVRALVRDPSRAGDLRDLGVDLVQGDITDPQSIRRAVSGCDTVVHLIALIQGRPRDFERVMTQGTRDLVEAAKDAGVRRFVLMSALGTSEQTRDLVPYFRSKWDMEQTVKSSGLPYVVFRPSFVFGSDGGALPTFVRLARLAPVTPIVGPGTQRIQPIWVDDVAAYFTAAVERDDVLDRTFELGGPDVVTWNELYTRLKRALGKRRPSINLPFGLMRVNAAVLDRLPGPSPITPDQVKMIAAGDNAVTNDDAVRTFGLPLVPLDEQLRLATRGS